MNIPLYWVRATGQVPGPGDRRFDLTAWGWSSVGRAEAEQKAHERLASLAQRVQQGLEFPRGYAYGGDRPLREEILREVRDRDGEITGIVTRNSYGSLVPNTRDAMFVDVDLPKPPAVGILARLLGRAKPAESVAESLAKLRATLASLHGSFRIYRTAAGWRVLATDRHYDPKSSEAQTAMREMGADPAFLQLCRVQESFRARLTPKPWRCGDAPPPGQHPREDEYSIASFARWLETYDRACKSKATCRFVKSVGANRVAANLSPIVELHDSLTRATTDLPLA
jgi:hypothetical protein